MATSTMSNCHSFYTQLGSIMEELANAAVAEICKLVDDSYAVLRLEMSRSYRENETLRKKLELMEMQFSHGKNASDEGKIAITGKQNVTNLWKHGKQTVHKEEDHEVFLDQDGQPEVFLVKEERHEENVCTEGSWEGLTETQSTGFKGLETEDGERDCLVNAVTVPAQHTKKCDEHPGAGDTSCEVVRLESAFKAETERDYIEQRLQCTDSEPRTETLNSAGSKSIPNWKMCQFGSLIDLDGSDKLTADAVYLKTGSLSFQFMSNSDVNCSELFDTSANPSRNSETCGRDQSKRKHYLCNYCGKNFARKNVLQTHQRIHTGEKPFGCTQCEKRFSDSSNLKKHQSVHTGEKPFICMQCGMRFSDSSSRKRHQSVHTGNKPFGCTQCGKRFTRLCHLKRHHMQIHL